MEHALSWILLIGGSAALAGGFIYRSEVCASLGYVCVVLGAMALGEKTEQSY